MMVERFNGNLQQLWDFTTAGYQLREADIEVETFTDKILIRSTSNLSFWKRRVFAGFEHDYSKNEEYGYYSTSRFSKTENSSYLDWIKFIRPLLYVLVDITKSISLDEIPSSLPDLLLLSDNRSMRCPERYVGQVIGKIYSRLNISSHSPEQDIWFFDVNDCFNYSTGIYVRVGVHLNGIKFILSIKFYNKYMKTRTIKYYNSFNEYYQAYDEEIEESEPVALQFRFETLNVEKETPDKGLHAFKKVSGVTQIPRHWWDIFKRIEKNLYQYKRDWVRNTIKPETYLPIFLKTLAGDDFLLFKE